MHPMIKPALRRSERGRRTVQFGVTRAHAVTVSPVDMATDSLLRLLDGTRGTQLLHAEAGRLGLSAQAVDELIGRLTAAGLVDDRPGSAVPDRLRPEHASLSVVHPEPGGAAERLAARRALRVQVRGAGRVGVSVAALLSAAGVGEVEVVDGGCVEPWDVSPGGLAAEQIGLRRDAAARTVVRRAAPEPRPRQARPGRARPGGTGPGGTGPGRARRGGAPPGGAARPAALVVLAPRDGLEAYAPDPAAAEQLRAAGAPHVYAGVLEGTGVVGPLVLPGGSACAGCLAAARAEREPEWPRMLAQWRAGSRSRGVPACDTALVTMVAGLAAAHALTFLDGQLPVCTGARLEFALPGLAWELTELEPHPRCGCGAAAAADRKAGVAHV